MRKIEEMVIIIPAFNEAAVIEKNLKQVLSKFRYVICVDDGSSDDTYRQAKKSDAIVLSHSINLGQGGGIQTGIDYALTLPVDYFCTFDADGQHSLDDVMEMLDVIKKEKLDIVVGSRFLGQAKNISKAKKAMLKLAVWFSNLTSGVKLTDTHNGLRVFNRYVAKTINLQELGFQHASEFIEKIAKNHYSYKEVPNTITYTEYSKAKGQSALNAINMGLDILFGKVFR